MIIYCPICSDLVNQAENINVTKCGHIFHHHCLSQWIERSKTCPQCRNKVTDKCLIRLYPTVSNDVTIDDAATLQSRLDDAQLQLRQKTAAIKESDDKLAKLQADLKKNGELLKDYERKIVSRDSAVSALKQQLECAKLQMLETKVLKTENEFLKKNIQTLNGLQTVLNATAGEVEQMLETYKDVNTLAIFAIALKKALCESELKLKESRQKLQNAQRKLGYETKRIADLQAKVSELEDHIVLIEDKYEALQKRKRKSSEELNNTTNCDKQAKHSHSDVPSSASDCVAANSPDIPQKWLNLGNRSVNDAILGDSKDSSLNSSVNTMVNKIENSDSPYLQLKQSSMALAALQRALNAPITQKQESALNPPRAIHRSPLKIQPTSIFSKKPAFSLDVMDTENDVNLSKFNVSFDGFGGHSKVDNFPVPKPKAPPSFIPKLTAKHKLKRPPPAGSQDISKMLEKLQK